MTQGFTGQEADGGTAVLDYFNARHLSARLGSFMQVDPGNAGADILRPQSWNGYAYVLGNPLGITDTSGMSGNYSGINDGGWGCYNAEYSTPCGGFPGGDGGGISIPIFGGGSGSGGGGSSAGSGSLPPGSFPGGESLGLPPGARVPGQFGGAGNPFIFSFCSSSDPYCASSPWTTSNLAVIMPSIIFSKAIQHDNPNPTKGVQAVKDKDGKIIGWTVPGKGTDKGKRIGKSLEWGTTNGLDPTDPKWAKAAIVTGLGAVTITEVLQYLGLLVF